ncbi:DUF4405 domain-containing protein [Chlorobium sp. BLA1]|uniref:DUF4405 domain-containing protein n=1 Tax=Candidatus Chlorobium masyuteum TaxID=2716876 RepID=UPI00141E56B9|nr:DUF4405 domain-containing protein [Candidatus Chlorobium masyuteum]NHQ60394.1 DUF4405 domain-containing protein [Candidatus Chlorobium masyuteum]NTU44031.1 DUF4405 domain-containing protein [Chlorobiaceae bacterium]
MNTFFSWRKFTSFGLFLSFLMILLSGVILYIFPGSRGGMWEMGGLSKQAWQQQHTIFGFAFSLFSLCHLFLINWKAFFSYLKTKTASGFRRPTEMVMIVLLSLFTGVGTLTGIQPFSGIIDLGNGISKSWDRNEAGAVAALSGERLSLAALSIEQGTGDGMPEHDGSDYHHHRHAGAFTSSGFREEAIPQDEINGGNGNPSGTRAENLPSRISSSGAPDDELHRQTTKSCSACH